MSSVDTTAPLLRRDWLGLLLGIGVVASVAQCLEVLVEIDSANGDEPGVIERVRRMLGLKPAGSAKQPTVPNV